MTRPRQVRSAAHVAFWRTWGAKLSSFLLVVLAALPQLAPRDLAAWFAEQFPFLPSWAHWGAVVVLGMARLWFAVNSQDKRPVDSAGPR